MRNRIIYLVLIILSSLLGIGSRFFAEVLPDFIANYAGDTFWAMAVYFLVRFIFPGKNKIQSSIISFAFSVCIELSQFYHVPWLDNIRKTIIGGLILGFGFMWSDLICYAAGIIIGLLLDNLLLTSRKL
ncbi:MAG: DUF2809 domain-containing protein [Bacteroidales bacterium]|nr:DUF2809 domain-containing protein [Bacteroidales bacterium]